MKVNGPGRWKLGQERNSWQRAKHTRPYSDRLEALRGQHSSAMGCQQRGQYFLRPRFHSAGVVIRGLREGEVEGKGCYYLSWVELQDILLYVLLAQSIKIQTKSTPTHTHSNNTPTHTIQTTHPHTSTHTNTRPPTWLYLNWTNFSTAAHKIFGVGYSEYEMEYGIRVWLRNIPHCFIFSSGRFLP